MGILDTPRLRRRPRSVKRAFYESPWRGRLRAIGWPRKRPVTPTPYEKALRDRMTEVNAAVKKMDPNVVRVWVDALRNHAKKHGGQKGSANIRLRDLLYQLLSGRLFYIKMDDGTTIYPLAYRQDVSDAMDWFEPEEGGVLTRTARGWRPTINCKPGSIFMMMPSIPMINCCPAAGETWEPTQEAAVPGKNIGDPLTIVDWNRAWWVGGPAFNAAGRVDGEALATWPDELGGEALTQTSAGDRPKFRASIEEMNGAPTVQFNGNNEFMIRNNLAQFPAVTTWTAVVQTNVLDQYKAIVDTAGPNRNQIALTSTGQYRIYSGAVVAGGVPTADAHLIIATFDSTGLDSLEVDGSLIAQGDAGSQRAKNVVIGRFATSAAWFWAGHIAFVGVANGALTRDQKADLLAWAQFAYGVP